MMKEIWKDIKDYEGLYQVSNLGRVKSLVKKARLHEYILKVSFDRHGYEHIHLSKNGISKSLLVHRVVAQAFIPNFDNLPEINHKDENKSNNTVNNLEWCTHQYNSSYGTRTSRIIPKTIDKTRKPVEQYDDMDNLIKVWYSMNTAARELNIPQQNISKCCLGQRKHAGGFKWKYHMKEGD